MTGPRILALTNAHGLRLALVSGRIGIPPRSAAPAADAASLSGGLPVVTAGPAPFALPGTEGPVILLELRPGTVSAPDAPLMVLDRPLALATARAAIFDGEQGVREFAAGLELLGVSLRGLKMRSDPTLFGGLWTSDLQIAGDRALARAWALHINRQERVSGALLIGDLAASGRPWQAASVTALRTPLRPGARSASHRLRTWARAFSSVDFIEGWSSFGLAETLGQVDPDLGGFAARYAAAADPLFPAELPQPSSPSESAAAFLLDHQGMTAGEVIEALAAMGRDEPDRLAPLCAALIGLGIGRSLIAQRYRSAVRDARLVRAEIETAGKAIASGK